MIFRPSKLEIDIYFQDRDHVSQSYLKKLIKGVENVKDVTEKELYYEEKGHFIIGSAVDTILTMGVDSFNAQYHISTSEKPSGKTLSVMHRLFDNMLEEIEDITLLSFSNIFIDNVMFACDQEDFQAKWGEDAKMKALTVYESYFNELCVSYGKQIITTDDKLLIDTLVSNIKNSCLGWIYDDKTISVSKDIDVYHQFPIYFEHLGIKCKALLDTVVVDHINKTINVIDLKTTGDVVINFKYNASKFRYDIQAAFYLIALDKWLIQQKELMTDNAILNDYTITKFAFIVESTIAPNGAVIFYANKEFINMGLYGRPVSITNTNLDNVQLFHNNIKGINDAFDDYAYYLENGFTREKEIAENNGILNLGWNRYINGYGN